MPDTSPWPRLLACWNGHTLTTVHQHADGRRAFASEQAVAHADLLERALARGLAGGPHPLCHAALVIPGPLGVSELRRRLGLQTLLLLARDQALGLALPELSNAPLQWLVPGPVAATTPALLCRLGDPTQLIAADGLPPAALMGLLQHPLSAMDADEALLLDAARADGRLLRLGQLLGPSGLVLAYRALARADGRALAQPLSGELLLARAPQDALARRACTLACAAIATLCALLAMAGVRRVMLCGSAALSMRHALQGYAWTPRLALLLGANAALPAIAVWDSEASHEPCLSGAARALDQQWQAHGPQGTDDVTALVRSSYPRLSRTERRVADLVLADAAEVLRTPTAGLARNAGISQPQVIRFCRSLGFEGVKTFRRALGASLALKAAGFR